jgi:hypothetical protein
MNVKIENFVGIFEDAFSEDFCKKVIDLFEASDRAGLTRSRQLDSPETSTIEKEDSQLHTEYSLYQSYLVHDFSEVFWNTIYPEYAKTYSVLKQAARHSNYAFKIQKTEIGQGYHVWHFESGSRAMSNRLMAWTLYLNDVEEGGETEFLYYPKRVKPKTGTLILWPAGFTHTHRGNPPISNTKYIVTGWVEL